jgi:hypothetical protein
MISLRNERSNIMNELLKEIENKNLIDDYNKCDYYLNKLNNGDISCLEDAIAFSNKKYAEFCIKDSEVALMNTNPISTNLDNISQIIINLMALKKMIIEYSKKNISKESK